MLVLRRAAGEEIVINETTRIRILKAANGQCSLGIDAPASERIRRAELAPESEQLIKQTAARMELAR